MTPTQEIELRPRSNSASTNREEGVNTEEALDKLDRTISMVGDALILIGRGEVESYN